MKYYKTIVFISLITFTGCSNQPVPDLDPTAEISLSGVWIFDKQDEQSFQKLQNALNYVPLKLNKVYANNKLSGRNSRPQNQQGKMLRDLMVGLLTIIPQELYILQTEQQVSIDFGVAGYHTFNMLERTEILMDGFEIDAFAGWKRNELLIHLDMGSSYKLIEKFTLLNDRQLLETIELKIVGRDNSLIHKRYFKQGTSTVAD